LRKVAKKISIFRNTGSILSGVLFVLRALWYPLGFFPFQRGVLGVYSGSRIFSLQA
jgi:NADH:ubiquinone oxidoreductase subunit 2 (subunit N)